MILLAKGGLLFGLGFIGGWLQTGTAFSVWSEGRSSTPDHSVFLILALQDIQELLKPFFPGMEIRLAVVEDCSRMLDCHFLGGMNCPDLMLGMVLPHSPHPRTIAKRKKKERLAASVMSCSEVSWTKWLIIKRVIQFKFILKNVLQLLLPFFFGKQT